MKNLGVLELVSLALFCASVGVWVMILGTLHGH